MRRLTALTVALGIICIPLLLEGSSTSHHRLRHKRMLPENQSCDPEKGGSCAKGDFVDKAIADCEYEAEPGTCTVSGKTGGVISWVVGPDKDNKCGPMEKGKKFVCGARGTNTRCVCSDYKIELNKCRCQYWTEATPGSHDPAFCTAYYLAGDSGVHHFACCNNCHDNATTGHLRELQDCNAHTYEGGSSSQYCKSCGKSTGGGLVKYDFNCGSCSVQTHCEAVCNRITGLRLPGFCWKWVNCFRGCCEAATKKKVAAEDDNRLIKSELKKRDILNMDASLDFCGDGNCSSFEDHHSCPADCCHLVNSKCSSVPSECTDDCCQLDTCCLDIIGER